MFRYIPHTIDGIRRALREAKEKYDAILALPGTTAFSVDTYDRLTAFYPNFDSEIIEMDAAKGAQVDTSFIEDAQMKAI